MSAPSWFLAGLLAGAAATSGIGLLWRTSRAPDRRGRPFLLGGAITAAAAIAAVAGLLLAIDSRPRAAVAPDEPVMTDSPQPMVPSSAGSSAAAMPPASMMSQILAMPRGSRPQSAEPMDQAAADLADRLQRQGGTAADWNLLAQAYDFLGRSDDAQRARARAAQVGAMQRAR
jgi:cytochrome c-type biogenesis protein CcmH/NrfG